MSVVGKLKDRLSLPTLEQLVLMKPLVKHSGGAEGGGLAVQFLDVVACSAEVRLACYAALRWAVVDGPLGLSLVGRALGEDRVQAEAAAELLCTLLENPSLKCENCFTGMFK